MDNATVKANLGDELWEASTSGPVADIESYISRQQTLDPSYKAPYQDIMSAATMKDHVEVVKYCLQQGATVNDNVMSFLITAESMETHKVLIEAKAIPIDHYIPWFGTVLSVAATDGLYEWTKFCLEAGADPNKDKVDDELSVLASAAGNGHLDVIRLLLDKGAVLDGSGAIVEAAKAGEKDAVALLLDMGADINEIGIKDATNKSVTTKAGSALHKAVTAGHMAIVQLLLEKGADINLTDVQGRTPLALAKQEGRADMIELLESHGGK
jgi:ankyrin repeat protein